MRTVTATVVGYDDFLPFGLHPEKHEFHIVVEVQGSGRRMRLRAPSAFSIPLRLEHFRGATLDEVRDRFTVGALITFDFMAVLDQHRVDPNFHKIDVIAINPNAIKRDYNASLIRGQVINFRTRRVMMNAS